MAARNPRRKVLAHLRDMNSWLRTITRAWDVRTTVYLPPGEHDPRAPGEWERPRRPDEYPENDPQAWDRLAQYMGAVRVLAEEVERYALARQHALLNTKPTPQRG